MLNDVYDNITLNVDEVTVCPTSLKNINISLNIQYYTIKVVPKLTNTSSVLSLRWLASQRKARVPYKALFEVV